MESDVLYNTLFLYCPRIIMCTTKHRQSNQIKLLLLSHHHSTSALVSEILERVLQTVQKQFTYGQYILTDCTEDNVQNTYTQYSQCTIRHTYTYQYTLYTVCTHSTLCKHIYTQIIHKLGT